MVHVPSPGSGSAPRSRQHQKPSPRGVYLRENMKGLTSNCPEKPGAEAAQVAPTSFPSSSFTAQLLLFAIVPAFRNYLPLHPPRGDEEGHAPAATTVSAPLVGAPAWANPPHIPAVGDG